jgi:flagellar biosynthesis protein FliP
MSPSSAERRVQLIALLALSVAMRAAAQASPAVTPKTAPTANAVAAAANSPAPIAPAGTSAVPGNASPPISPANAQVNIPPESAPGPQSATTGTAAIAATTTNASASPSTTTYDIPAPMDLTPGATYYAPATPATNDGGALQIQGLQGESVPWSIVILLTALTLIPSLLLCVTPFARLLIVFHFLRQALGLQTTPSNQTLIGLSLILTFFLMQPVGAQIYESAIVPMQSGQINAMEALGRSEAPMRKFMSHYVREKDVALFVDLAKEPRPATTDDVSMRVLLPAYILSELKAGFQIGTVLFLPFLIVDMVVASITTSVGMLQLPPVVISTPLKLLLFLMVDGWHLLIGSLMRSFS